uniref:Uncharacterized protein n=1 Tax=Ciona savignyi TaxID=51511 RepID=H2YD30_CIOSA
MGESGGQHHQTNENAALTTSYYEGDSSMQMKSTATTDAAFKLPSGTAMHRRRKSYESHSGAQHGENFETSFSDEDDDSSNNGRIEHRSTVRNDVFLFKIFVLFYQVFRSCGAVIAGTVWSMGRFLYQSVTQVLLLDTWVLTRVTPASPFFQAASKFLRWLLIILGILCASILLYSSYPDREKVHIQSTIHQKTYWDMIWSFSKPGAFFDSVQDGKWPDSASSSGSSAMNEASLKRAMEDLQLAIGELEVRVADRHSSILDK